jgi:hypothetical protein
LGGFALACAKVLEGTIDKQDIEVTPTGQDFLSPKGVARWDSETLVFEENVIEQKYAKDVNPSDGEQEPTDFEDAKSCLSYTSIEHFKKVEPKPSRNLFRVSVSTQNILRPGPRLPLPKKNLSQQQIPKTVPEPRFSNLKISANSGPNLRRGKNIRRGPNNVGKPAVPEYPYFRQNKYRILQGSNLLRLPNLHVRGQKIGASVRDYQVDYHGVNVRCSRVF